MFEILDGREQFYQWDLDRKLKVNDTSVTEVHYCNKTGECSLVCEVYELEGNRVADVPNILLQTDWDIRVFAYCADYTKVERRFKVNARTKPDTYIYTETEIFRVEKLVEEAVAEAINRDDLINDVVNAIPKAENGSGEYGLVKLGSTAKGITLTADNELILKEASVANLENNSTQLVVTKPSLHKHLIALGTHQQMNDKYDVNTVAVPNSFEGRQGELPASYNAVKAYVDNKAEDIVKEVLASIPDGDEVSY